VSERLTIGGGKSHGGTVERIGLRKWNLKERLTLEVGLEIVIGVKVV